MTHVLVSNGGSVRKMEIIINVKNGIANANIFLSKEKTSLDVLFTSSYGHCSIPQINNFLCKQVFTYIICKFIY